MSTDLLTLSLQRFNSHVERPLDPDGCWTWTGPRTPDNYGKYRSRLLDTHLAHRAAYLYWVGQIPEGLEIDHLCRNTLCVNPRHLEPVDRAENIRRRYLLVTHCKHGHAFDEANTYTHNGRRRYCRACNRRNVAESKARRTAS